MVGVSNKHEEADTKRLAAIAGADERGWRRGCIEGHVAEIVATAKHVRWPPWLVAQLDDVRRRFVDIDRELQDRLRDLDVPPPPGRPAEDDEIPDL